LPVAGLMSTEPGEVIAEQYKKADALVKSFGVMGNICCMVIKT
jgi:adenine deaminase